MSEYATRKSDGKYIYIGFCDEMSCLRYEDRDKVKPQSRFGWNSKSAVMCLCGVKNEEREMKILYTYVGCNSKWSVPFPTIQHLILSEEMKMRLFRLCSSYWEERNPGKEYPDAMTRQTGNGKAKVSLGYATLAATKRKAIKRQKTNNFIA